MWLVIDWVDEITATKRAMAIMDENVPSILRSDFKARKDISPLPTREALHI
jgi:hypothetical protein